MRFARKPWSNLVSFLSDNTSSNLFTWRVGTSSNCLAASLSESCRSGGNICSRLETRNDFCVDRVSARRRKLYALEVTNHIASFAEPAKSRSVSADVENELGQTAYRVHPVYSENSAATLDLLFTRGALYHRARSDFGN